MTRFIAALLVPLLLATACGIALDDSPRAVEMPESTTTLPRTSEPGAFEAELYFVHDGFLMPVRQELPDRTLDAELDMLLSPPEALSERYELATSIPAGTEILDVERDGTHMTVDLSGPFENVVGRSRQQAIGQMVLTVTGLSGIMTMSFEVDGRPLRVTSPARGDRLEVGACDYASLLATVDQGIDAGLPAAAIQRLELRQQQLDDCALEE